MNDKHEHNLDNILTSAFKKYLNSTGLRSHTVSTSFGEMHYYDSDSSSNLRPFIFVHGLGSSAQSWWILAKMLRNKRRILLPDLFHMSGYSKANNDQMNILEHAQSIQEFIHKILEEPAVKARGETSVDLCGLSLGGWISMLVAAINPKLVSKLILLNPAGIKTNLSLLHDTFKFVDEKKFRAIYPGIMKAFPFTKAPLFSNFARSTLYKGIQKEGVQKFVANTKIEHFADDYLPQIQCKVLLLWGKEDQLLSLESPQIIVRKVKNITAKWVHHCAHVLALEAPVNCYNEINHFLKTTGIKDNKFCNFVSSWGRLYPVSPIEK